MELDGIAGRNLLGRLAVRRSERKDRAASNDNSGGSAAKVALTRYREAVQDAEGAGAASAPLKGYRQLGRPGDQFGE